MLLTDEAAVDCLVAEIIGWGKMLPEWRQTTSRLGTSTFTGQSFQAEVRVIQDREKQDGSLAIEIWFRRRGPGRHCSRYLLISQTAIRRRLDDPRLWRTLASASLKRKRKHRRLLWSVHLSREIYLADDVPTKDLRAQIVLAMVQMQCL